VGDRPLKGTRGRQHPVAQKTRLSQHHPYVSGVRIVILMAPWDPYRIPVDLALVRRTADPAYQTETALFRHMLQAFRRPAWCPELVVTADAAYEAAGQRCPGSPTVGQDMASMGQSSVMAFSYLSPLS
jgi:hypothetical protein